MANILYLLNKPQDALRELERPEPALLSDSARLLLAEIYVQSRQYDQAEALYRSHLLKRPQDDNIRMKLADVLSWQKKYKESLAEYERLLQGHPQDSQLRRKYAFVLSWSGRHHDAARELRKTLGE
jgi:thioredoxin-like negative regulator of GroEL